MNNALLKEWMIFCQERIFRQHPAGLINNHPNKPGSYAEVKQTHPHMIRAYASKNHLVKIQPVTKQQSYRHKSYNTVIAFRGRAHIY